MIDTIYFEGPTCCGKSTMMNEFNKITNYQYTCIDRGHLSGVVEATLRGRDNLDFRQQGLDAELLNERSLIVLCGYWNYDENRKRWMTRGDTIVTDVKDLRREYDTWKRVIDEQGLSGHKYVKRVSHAANLVGVIESMNRTR